MKISIAADKVRFTLPVPLSIVSFAGPLVIKNLPDDKLPAEIKSWIIRSFPDIIQKTKQYKGLTIVDVETAKGEKVVVKI